MLASLSLLLLASGAADFNRDPCNAAFNFSHLPQCDAGLSARERSAALAAAMTLGQKIAFVGGGYQSGMPELGIPLVAWSDGIFMSISNNWLGNTQNLSKWAPFPTVLPGPMTIAASFDLDLVARAAAMVSDEARSLNNDVSARYGLVGTIVMNTCRDPRWGSEWPLPQLSVCRSRGQNCCCPRRVPGGLRRVSIPLGRDGAHVHPRHSGPCRRKAHQDCDGQQAPGRPHGPRVAEQRAACRSPRLRLGRIAARHIRALPPTFPRGRRGGNKLVHVQL